MTPADWSGVRADKLLWSVRVYKTRSLATEACKNGRVHIEGVSIKASREIRVGDTLTIRLGAFTRTIAVIGLIQNRVSAKLVAEYITELTPPEEFEKLKMIRDLNYELRDRGQGRPSKKDRRDIERLKGE